MTTPTLPAPLKPGHLGIDWSGAAIDFADAAKQGARFAIRYDAGAGDADPATAWKQTKPGEIEAIVAAGLDFIANTEWYAARMLEGASAGTADGAAALAFWQSRGLAKGATIYASADCLVTWTDRLKVLAYAKAFDAALNGYYSTSVYVGTPIIAFLLSAKAVRYGWRPNAGSWSNDGIPYQPRTTTAADRAALLKLALGKTKASILQTGNYWYGKSADENMILRTPTGSHCEALRTLAPKVDPKPKPGPKPPVPFRYPSGNEAAYFAACLMRGALLGGDHDLATREVFGNLVQPEGEGILARIEALEAAQAAAQTKEAL